MLEDNEDLIKDNQKISNLFNDLSVNIVEHSKGKNLQHPAKTNH